MGSAEPPRGGAVLLWGFMGTGKSSVGPLLARALGWTFVDLDEVIAAAAGASLADLFAREGEAAFRVREQQALWAAVARPGVVVAPGGGALCSDEALDRARAAGPLVVLRADVDEILRRIGGGARRPLLARAADPRRAAQDLLAARRRFYDDADLAVATDGRTPAVIAVEIAAWLRRHGLPGAPDHVVPVELGERRYPVVVAQGYAGLHRHLAPSGRGGPGVACAIVTDANVAQAQLPLLLADLAAAGLEPTVLTIEPGEASKSLGVAERVLEGLVAAGLERRSVILGVGGGVVGDLAGFVASIYLRGVPYVAVPTSLLAQVDASVGGKTGVNLGGKNLVGTFYQPQACYVNLEALATLPAMELRAGCAEVVKHALIADAALLDHLERHAERIAQGDLEALEPCVRRSIEIKAQIVARDEREAGERLFLNLGHTVGHAIEAASAYRVRHGEAVAVGLLAALRLSARRALCDAALEPRIAALLGRLGLPTAPEPWLRREVLDLCVVDKKRAAGSVRFVAVTAPGSVRIVPLTVGEIAADLLPEGDR
ncbi:MAG: 3-dehydroquinate synthase [Deltaproteobacteria bacterium]|nr:3-dehydroquinate synthase [Deltaproteobacteria bacterium]